MSTTRPHAPRRTVTFLERRRGIGVALTLLVLLAVGGGAGAVTGTVLIRLVGAVLTGVGGGP